MEENEKKQHKIQPFQLPKGVDPEPGTSDAHFWDLDEETDAIWRQKVGELYERWRKEGKDT